MYLIKDKILFLIPLMILFATNNEAFEKKIAELSAGDIININNFNAESTETFGDIFNGYKASHFIEVKLLAGFKQISVEKKICLPYEDLASYYYPEINVDDAKIDSSKIFDYTNQTNLFSIDPDFIDDSYLYGIIKVCWIVKTQKLLVQVLEKKDIPNFNHRINYKLLLDKTAVLRFRLPDETHYVSSISTGECFLQAFVNSAELCRLSRRKKFGINNINSFIISSVHESRVKTTSNIQERENYINNYMMRHRISVYHLNNTELVESLKDQFGPEEKPSVIELNLKILPDLPEFPSPLTAHKEFLADLVPGDVIDLDDLKHVHSLLRTDNFLVDVYDHTTSPFFSSNYSNCDKFSEDETIKIEYTPYKLHPNYFTEYYWKFNVFDEVINRRDYGVDKKYLDNKYKCMKVKICSEFIRTKLIIPSVYVVNLEKNDIDKVRIFDSKNVLLRYKLGNETHYVARTEKGNCLFQALIYENLDNSSHTQQIEGPLLYKGKILSADDNQSLEEWAEKYVSDFQTKSYKTLAELINHRISLENIYSKLSHETYTMINIYLDKLN